MLQASTTTRSSRKRDPGTMRGPSISAAKQQGVATTPVTGGATSYGPGSSAAGGRGPRAASTSRSARSMLPVGRGASVRHAQSTSWCGTPKGQGDGGPWGGAVHRAVWRRSNAQGTSGAGCPPGGNLRLVPAARRVPAAFSPRARGSGGGGGGRRVHCSEKCQRKK
jgi:hypothetical protein